MAAMMMMHDIIVVLATCYDIIVVRFVYHVHTIQDASTHEGIDRTILDF